MLDRLVKHSSHYTLGSLLVTTASLVSFPLFTRLLTVSDYGTLNLIASLLALWTGLGKLGTQQAITRVDGEINAGGGRIGPQSFTSTVLLGMTMTGLAGTAGWLLMALLVPPSWWNDSQVAHLLVPLALLVLVRVLDSGVSNLLRSRQRSLVYIAYTISRRYFSIALILVMLLGVMRGVDGFYLATFAVETVALAVVMAWMLRQAPADGPRFDGPTFLGMIRFGLPLVSYEIAGVVLNLGDRFLLQQMAGPGAVGHYSAAYNFCDYVRAVAFVSISQAVAPLYVKIFEESGEEATARFVERSLHMYLVLSMGVMAGMVATGGQVLTLLAGDKYADAAPVIPFVIAAFCIDGAAPFFTAGMYVRKKTRMLVPVIVGAAVLNVALNILLIPPLGIVGSALATLISYVVIVGCAWTVGAKYLRVRFPYLELLKFAALAAIMYVAVINVHASNVVVDLLAKVAVGVFLYAALVVAFDGQARRWATSAAITGWARLAREGGR